MKARYRYLLIAFCVVALLIIFIFQKFNYSQFFSILSGKSLESNVEFAINRVSRFLLNDTLMVILIYALFNSRRYAKFAFMVEIAGLFLILIPYLFLRLELGVQGYIISFMHRLVINPTLLILLIPYFYYQRYQERRELNEDQ